MKLLLTLKFASFQQVPDFIRDFANYHRLILESLNRKNKKDNSYLASFKEVNQSIHLPKSLKGYTSIFYANYVLKNKDSGQFLSAMRDINESSISSEELMHYYTLKARYYLNLDKVKDRRVNYNKGFEALLDFIYLFKFDESILKYLVGALNELDVHNLKVEHQTIYYLILGAVESLYLEFDSSFESQADTYFAYSGLHKAHHLTLKEQDLLDFFQVKYSLKLNDSCTPENIQKIQAVLDRKLLPADFLGICSLVVIKDRLKMFSDKENFKLDGQIKKYFKQALSFSYSEGSSVLATLNLLRVYTNLAFDSKNMNASFIRSLLLNVSMNRSKLDKSFKQYYWFSVSALDTCGAGYYSKEVDCSHSGAVASSKLANLNDSYRNYDFIATGVINLIRFELENNKMDESFYKKYCEILSKIDQCLDYKDYISKKTMFLLKLKKAHLDLRYINFSNIDRDTLLASKITLECAASGVIDIPKADVLESKYLLAKYYNGDYNLVDKDIKPNYDKASDYLLDFASSSSSNNLEVSDAWYNLGLIHMTGKRSLGKSLTFALQCFAKAKIKAQTLSQVEDSDEKIEEIRSQLGRSIKINPLQLEKIKKLQAT